jgi:hypothetical protein
MLRMKVGVSRKEATDRDGSVSATCEVEVEIPGSATDEEVLRIRDHWLEVCEATVDEELERLQGGTSDPRMAAHPAPSTATNGRSKAVPSQDARREYRVPTPPRGPREAGDEHGDMVEDRHSPSDGRQLLGWAAKQDPDAKGLVISFGKKKGYPPKIVDWDDEQVRTAYRYARGQQGRR